RGRTRRAPRRRVTGDEPAVPPGDHRCTSPVAGTSRRERHVHGHRPRRSRPRAGRRGDAVWGDVMLVEFANPGGVPLAFEADDVCNLHPSDVESDSVTEVFLRNGTRCLVAGAYPDVLRRIREARSTK